MKKAVFILFLIFISSCKEDNKKTPQTETPQVEVTKEVKENSYPKFEPKATEIKPIFEKEYSFSNDLIINSISVLRNSEDSFDIIFHINDSTDYEKLNDLIIGSTFYPTQPEMLIADADRKKKIKRVQSKAKVFNLDEELIFKISNFTIKPKEFKKAQFWLYSKDGKVIDDNFLIIPAFTFE